MTQSLIKSNYEYSYMKNLPNILKPPLLVERMSRMKLGC